MHQPKTRSTTVAVLFLCPFFSFFPLTDHFVQIRRQVVDILGEENTNYENKETKIQGGLEKASWRVSNGDYLKLIRRAKSGVFA